MNETERDSNVARQLTPPSHGRRLNEPRNINPSRVDDKRANFLVRLVAAASSAHPTKYGQNERAGIQDGAIFWINSGPPWKCSGANTASGTAMKTQPKVMSLSQPRAAPISFRSIKTPATR